MFFRLNRWLHRKGLSRQKVKGTWIHRQFGDVILRKEFWSLRTESLARACLIGLTITTIPMPGQSLVAIPLALYYRANVPLTVLLLFLSSPITMPVHLPICFFVGSFILGDMPSEVFAQAGTAFTNGLFTGDSANYVWSSGIFPLYLGSVVLGPILGAIGYFLVKMLWRETPRVVILPLPVRRVEEPVGRDSGR